VNVNDKEVGGEIRLDVGRMGNAMSNAYIGARFLNGDNNNSTTIADPDPLMEVSFMVMQAVRGVPGLKDRTWELKPSIPRLTDSATRQYLWALKQSCNCRLNTPFRILCERSVLLCPI
jgi:hypothetical protein